MTRNSLVIFCIAAYIDLVLATNSCLMTNEVHDCVYTVECEHYAGSAPNPSCELEPYVTFVVKSSFVETLTAGFFGSTNFDSRVRVIEGKDNRWLNIEEATFRYFTKTQLINLSNNNIQNIRNFAFKNLVALQSLNLSKNAIETLSARSLMTVEGRDSEYLKMIDLSSNQIIFLSSEVFDHAPNLEELFLNNNNIKHIEDNVFGALSNLYRLTLQNNLLTSINMTLINLKSLIYLDLSYNNISAVFGYELNRLTSLQVINMTHNAIKTVDGNCFTQAFNLFQVDFSNNCIESELENIMFVNNAKLDYLTFENNNITKLHDGVFKHTALRYLNLEGNKIDMLLNISSNGLTNLRYGTFKGLHRTEVLDLSRNAISDIDEHVFHECLSLKKLIIDYNRIKKFDIEKVVTIVPTLSLLSLGGNPIKCKEIVRSFNNVKNVKRLQFFITNEQISPSSKLEITSIDKVYHEDNVHGIKCGYDDETGVESSKQGTDPKPDNSNTSLITTVIVTTVLLTIVTISAITGLFLYRKWFASSDPYGESRLQMRQSIDLNGSDFRGDLLN
ncbi:unnamed protein product [Leptosia nina]|uniref:Uncharacterized protein n=1 Tax=Leptosia nina TaxID=320188 RepID=A0AAV1JU68_9NEOP